MNTKTYNIILIALVSAIEIAIDLLAVSLWWQHQAIVHHAAHYEVSSRGITSFHWNDEYAQIINADDHMGLILGLDETKPWDADSTLVLQRATAAQRAEAFLRTIGQWEEGK